MVFTNVRWFNIVAPLAVLAATMFIVPSVHAYTVDIKGGVSSTTTYTDGTVYIATSGTPGYIKWNSDISDTVGSCVVANFPKPPYSYFTGVSSGTARQTGGITQTTAYTVECFVDGYLVASDSVTFTVGTAPVQTPPFSVRKSSATPPYQIIPAGSLNAKVHVLSVVNNASEAISLRSVNLKVIANAALPQEAIKKIYLYSGTTVLGSTSIVSSSTVPIFLTTPLNINAFDYADISVRVDLQTQGYSDPGVPGVLVYIEHNDAAIVQPSSAVGVSSGLTYAAQTDWSRSNGFRAFRTVPTVQNVGPSTGTLVGGPNTINKVNITAAPTHDISLHRLVFQTSVAPCLGTPTFQLYGSYGPVHSSLVTADALGRVVISFDETNVERIIPASSSKTYELRATILPVSGYGYISSKLLGDVAYTEDVRTLSAYKWDSLPSATSTSNFIWSPNSYLLATPSLIDWTNGYGVMGLPSAGVSEVVLSGSMSSACPSSIQMTAPVGGETIMPLGNPLVIKWTPNGDNPNVKAYLESYSNGTYTTLGEMIPSAKGSIYWVGELDRWGNYPVPGSYYVRIVDTTTGAWDRSDGMITVLPVDYMSADLKINGSDGPIASSKDSVTVSWTSRNTNTCDVIDPYSVPVIMNLPSSGNTTTSFTLVDGSYARRVTLRCTSQYGMSYDNVEITPIPYPSARTWELQKYDGMKYYAINAGYHASLEGKDTTLIDLSLVAQLGIDLHLGSATTSLWYPLTDQINALTTAMIVQVKETPASDVDAIDFSQLHALLAQLRGLLGAPDAQCSDGLDNDGDGKIDYPADPGCVSSIDIDEFNPLPISQRFALGQRIVVSSSDGSSGVIVWDVPVQSSQTSQPIGATGKVISGPIYTRLSNFDYWWWKIDFDSGLDINGWVGEMYLSAEKVACADGLDNDGDGKIDYPADPGCTSATDNDEYNVPPVNATVTGLMLVDANADTDLFYLDNNMVVAPNQLSTSAINVRAVTSGNIGKVLFYQNGVLARSEGTAPYALAGDNNGNYYSWSYQLDTPYQITALPFDLYGATGTPYALSVTFHNEVATTTPPTVCADGADNDGDGKIDYPADPGCTSASDNDEYDAPTTPNYGNNIITNSGFENAKNGWSGWGTRVKLTSSEQFAGAKAVEFVHNKTGTRTLNNGTTYAVVPGSKVLASAYVKSVGAGTTDAYLELEWRNASGSILKRDQVAYTGGATTWTKIEKTLTVPANATKLKIRLKDSATPSVGSVFFDDVSVRLAETVTAREGFFSIMFSNVLSAVQLVSAKQ